VDFADARVDIVKGPVAGGTEEGRGKKLAFYLGREKQICWGKKDWQDCAAVRIGKKDLSIAVKAGSRVVW